MKPSAKPRAGVANRGAAVLGRVSTEELAKGDSVNRQIVFGRNFCAEKLANDINAEIYEIREEGVSGKTFDRDGVHEFLRLAQEKKIRYVVVLDVSRFGRNTKEGLQTLDELLAFDVDVRVVTMPWLDYRTHEGKKQWSEQLAEAECARGQFKDKAVAGMWDRASQGYWKGGIAPYGFICERKQLVQDSEPARMIGLVFETFEKTGTVMATIAHFRKDTLLIWPQSARPKHPKPPTLTANFINDVLRNPAYAGYVPAPAQRNALTKIYIPDLEYRGRPYFKGKQVPIVGAKLWSAVQSVLDQGNKPAANRSWHAGSDEYLLQGLLTCGCCGMKFSNGSTGERREKVQEPEPGKTPRIQRARAKILRYVCRSFSTQGASTSCQNRDLPLGATETAVIRTLAGLAQNPDLIARLSSDTGASTAQSAEKARAEIEALEKERAMVLRKIDNGVQVVCEHPDTALAKKVAILVEKMTSRDAAITSELATLKARTRQTSATPASAQQIKQALGHFEEALALLPRGRVKHLIRVLVEDIQATKILDRADPLYQGLASSSLLIRMTIRLSATGIQYVANTPLSIVASAGSPPPQSRSCGVVPIVFEIRREGSKGNVVYIVEPTALGSKMVAFTGGQNQRADVVVTMDKNHPISRAQQARQLQNKGMLKKDIAKDMGISAGYVSYLFRILKLDTKIWEALVAPNNHRLRSWFGINRLLGIAAEKTPPLQIAAFEKECRLAPGHF